MSDLQNIFNAVSDFKNSINKKITGNTITQQEQSLTEEEREQLKIKRKEQLQIYQKYKKILYGFGILFIILFSSILIAEMVLSCYCLSEINGQYTNLDSEFKFMRRAYISLITVYSLIAAIVIGIIIGIIAINANPETAGLSTFTNFSNNSFKNILNENFSVSESDTKDKKFRAVIISICVIIMLLELIFFCVYCAIQYHISHEIKILNGNPSNIQTLNVLKQTKIYNIILIILTLFSFLFLFIYFVIIIVINSKIRKLKS